MDGSYLSLSSSHRSRRRESSAFFGSNTRGAVACLDVCRPVPCRAPAGWAPLAAKWSSGVGVRFPVAGRRRDHLSEGSRRREAHCSTWWPRSKVSRPRPARDLHRTPHLPAHTPRARSRAPCFHHLSPLAPLILADDARSRWSILARAKGAPAAPARPPLALPAPLPPPCAAARSAQLLGTPPSLFCPPTPCSCASFGVCAQAPCA